MRRDYYAVLGVASTAGLREMRQAYRRLARQYSPDVNFWDTQARDLFGEMEGGSRGLRAPAARGLSGGSGHALRDGEALAAGRHGEDVHVTVQLAFADVVRGTNLRLEVVRFSSCAACGATGVAGDARCRACDGRGVRRAVDPVSVTIPAGVDTGSQIRVTGEGSAGPFGGPRGDLIVSTRVQEHPFFQRKGDSVHCEVPISVWEAILGARIRVPTPSGEAVLVIPSRTTGGQVLRLPGQGLPRLSAEAIRGLVVAGPPRA